MKSDGLPIPGVCFALPRAMCRLPLQGLLIYSVIDFIDPNDFHGSFPL